VSDPSSLKVTSMPGGTELPTVSCRSLAFPGEEIIGDLTGENPGSERSRRGFRRNCSIERQAAASSSLNPTVACSRTADARTCSYPRFEKGLDIGAREPEGTPT
jgi:hypothetical protein